MALRDYFKFMINKTKEEQTQMICQQFANSQAKTYNRLKLSKCCILLMFSTKHHKRIKFLSSNSTSQLPRIKYEIFIYFFLIFILITFFIHQNKNYRHLILICLLYKEFLPAKMNNLTENLHGKDADPMQEEPQALKQASQNLPNFQGKPEIGLRKKQPPLIEEEFHKKQPQIMDIEKRNLKKLKFQDLPQTITFYLIEIYQFMNRLLITGIMKNGQTINIFANDVYRDYYFALRRQNGDTDQVSPEFLKKAKKQIDQRLKQAGVQNIVHADWIQKSYVFEIDDVPEEKRPYYRVRFPFKTNLKDGPHPDWQGTYFKYVFGTTYTPSEIFITQSRIKGPCWVQVDLKMLTQTKNNLTLSADVISPECITPLDHPQKTPEVRVMSISIKSILPSKLKLKKIFLNNPNENQIYCISYSFCDKYTIQTKPKELRLIKKSYFLSSLQVKNLQNTEGFDNQKLLIGKFVSDLKNLDPDFIVCHDSAQVLDTLIQRMEKLDKSTKPLLGRLHHSYDSGKNQYHRINSSLAGRVLVDTFIHSKDMIRQIDYSLEAMSKHIKPEKKFVGLTEEQIIDILNLGKTKQIVEYANKQAEITFLLMNHLQVLQTTKSLSNICGNTWKRSLQNQRAERNEYLIMHECIERDIIIPDKFKVAKGEQAEQGDKKKYEGGLVLQPKTGMYTQYILLLDFNSLYPSLIRQYNICFSKIKRPKLSLSYYYKAKQAKPQQKKKKKLDHQTEKMEIQRDEQIKVVPPPRQQCKPQKWGFLPFLINQVVQMRKKCKNKMKGNVTPQQIVILDIQQKCYKVVANSIYGCLGFKFNRFYSKHLAALVTRMGRQALLRSKDIVNSRGMFQVIYGDTDSLMMRPVSFRAEKQIDKILQLKQMAEQLSKQINKQYASLKIDIDGVYKPLILLQKKKYVANKLVNLDDVFYKKVEPKFTIESKGIQVVRRDGCPISRTVLKKVIQILMRRDQDQGEMEDIQLDICKYFETLKKELPTVQYKQYLLANFLQKKIADYPVGNQLSHVKVAIDRRNNGEKQQTLVGHAIYYLICKPRSQTEDSYAKRSWDPKTYQKSQKLDKEGQKLQIDYDYYKVQILKPVTRILNAVKITMDKICDIMEVNSLNRERIKKMAKNQDQQENIQGNMLEIILNKNLTEKSQKMEEQIGKFKCCNQELSLVHENKWRITCPTCDKNLLNILINKITLLLKRKTSEYYNNNMKCQCSKQYILTPISSCCTIKYRHSSLISAQLHNEIYLLKELTQFTKKNTDVLIRQADDIKSKKITDNLKYLLRYLENFLEQSQFENVDNLLQQMKL